MSGIHLFIKQTLNVISKKVCEVTLEEIEYKILNAKSDVNACFQTV